MIGAMAMVLTSTFGIAFVADRSLMILMIALIQAGPFMMTVGWLANKLGPDSKIGWTLVLFGFNCFCGFLLAKFEPTRLYFGSWDSTGVIFVFLLLVIALNSWQTFYHTDEYFYLRKIWANKPTPRAKS